MCMCVTAGDCLGELALSAVVVTTGQGSRVDSTEPATLVAGPVEVEVITLSRFVMDEVMSSITMER